MGKRMKRTDRVIIFFSLVIVIIFLVVVFGTVISGRQTSEQMEQKEKGKVAEKEETDAGKEEMDSSELNTETSRILDITVQKDEDGKLEFSVSIDEFISCYNGFYSESNRTYYIKPRSEWYSYVEDFGKHTGDIHYEFAADKKKWTLPTIAVYTSDNEIYIRELTVNFDDHSYTEKMYKQYEELCFYTLRVFFPKLSEQKITRLYKKLNELAYENIYQNEQGFNSDNPNPPCALYYKNEIGVYPYFALGESVRLCIIPVTEEVVREYEKKGTIVREIE